MKKIFTFCVSLLAALSVFAYDFQSGDLFYNITSSSAPYTVEVTQQSQYYNSNYSGVDTIVIPETVTYDSIIYSVTSIGESAFDHSKLTTITIPNTVTSIGEYAFAYCQKLTSVVIGSGVKTIHMAAFNNCSALRTITIPANVKEIYNQAFTGASISTIYMEGTTPPSLLQSKSDGSAFMIFSTTPTCYVPCSAVASYKASTKWKGAVREFVAEFPYTFTIASANTSLGTIAITQQPDCSTAAIFEAIPNTGCYFTQWSDGNTDNPRTLKVTQDTRLTASFASSTYVVNLIAGANGAVSGAGTYDHGATATITAIPNDGYHFTQWSDGNTDNPRSIVVVEPILLTALFEENYTQEHCQIIYTSTDGDVVTPWVTYNFGADIVSNTYADGQGVITFDGPVTAIGDTAFANCSSLESIIIPDRVTAIGDQAFQYCTYLKDVTIGNRVESIGTAAFNNCSSLQSITIPQSVKYIYNYAFVGASLNSIYVNRTIPPTLNPEREDPYMVLGTGMVDVCYIPCGKLASYQISEWKTKGQVREFVERPSYLLTVQSVDKTMGTATITQDIDCETQIAAIAATPYDGYRFVQWSDGNTDNPRSWVVTEDTYLEAIFEKSIDPTWQITYTSTDGNVVTPNAIKVFGANIVSNTYENGVGTITFDGPVTSIGNSAFRDCFSLISITIPNSVTSIGSQAFAGCSGLISITIPNSVTSIGESAFRGCYGLTSVTIPNNVTSIGTQAFAGCSSLTSITIPNSVTSIGNYAFQDCSGLTSIVVDGENTTYDSRENCNAIIETATNTLITGCQNTIIPNSVMSIGEYAFYGCRSLTSITIPNSVTSIGNYAFWNCSSLDTIYVEATTPPALEDSTVFRNTPSPVCVIPCGTLSAYQASGWAQYVSEFVEDGCIDPTWQITYTSTHGNIVTPQKTDVFGANIVSNTYENGQGVITFDGPVTSIGSGAFSGRSSLTSITIPNSVTSIGEAAFYDCTSLTSITIPNSVKSIGRWAFSNCSGLTSIVVDGENTTYDSRENCNAIIETATNTLITGCQNTIIPNSVTSIGEEAFLDCSSLTSITIPESVTSIGDGAFAFCNALASITIPNSVTSIGKEAFGYCTSLTSVTIGNSVTSIGEAAFLDCTSLTTVTIPNSVTSIGSSAFTNCTSLTSITIPNSVTSIGDFAFNECSSLISITIPESVTSIGEWAFAFCESLTSVNIPHGITNIASATFGACTSLKSIIIPNSVTSIGELAFALCESLTSVNIPHGITNIASHTFEACTSLKSIIIPNSVTSIGDQAFLDCSSLDTIYVEATTPPALEDSTVFMGTPSPVCVIPCGTLAAYEASDWASQVGAFEDPCYVDPTWQILYTSSNDSIVTPNKTDVFGANIVSNIYENGVGTITFDGPVTSVGEEAFQHCSSLTSITIPNSVTSIGGWAFYGCDGLTFIIIPNSVTSIGRGAFQHCSSLSSVTIGNSVKSIGDYAFVSCTSLTSITIPNSVTSIGESAFSDCDDLSSMVVEEGNTKYDSRENCNAIIEKATNTLIAGCQNTTIPNSVTSIGNSAFVSCSSLTSITIPNSVTSIGNGAFEGCSYLTSITIPNSVTSIGYEAFLVCSSLTSITIPNSVTSIEYGTFWNCSSLTSITIPNSVTSIGDDAFVGCSSLDTIYLEATTPTTLGQNVFENTPSPLCVIPCGTLAEYEMSRWKNYVEAFVFDDTCDSKWCGDELYWKYGDGVLTLIGTGDMYDYASDIDVPWYDVHDKITSINIPNGVSKIGNNAFASCISLDEIYVEAAMPPALGDNALASSSSCFIPCGAIATYQSSNWAQYVSEFVEVCPAVVKAKVPASWEDDDITVWVWTDGAGTEYPTTKEGDWYVYTHSDAEEFNIIFKSGTGWKDEIYHRTQTVDIKGITENTCLEIQPTTGKATYTIVDCEMMVDTTEYFITYTSTDGNIVTPYATDVFGANIVSNTYENGVGTITFDAPITSIGEEAFQYCSSLTSITIPNSVTSIGNLAFRGCLCLSSITIPNSVTNIESHAFRECSSLKSITIPSSVTGIGKGAFEGAFENYCGLVSITVDSDNRIYDSRENCNAIIETATNTLVVGCQNTIIPNSVTIIGERAFRGSTFTSITIPSSVTSIEYLAFFECDSLDAIYMEAITPPTLGNQVFDGAASFSMHIPCGSLAAYEASDWASKVDSFEEEGCPVIQMCGDDLYWEYADGVLTITGTGDMYDYAADTDVPWYDVRGNIKTVSLPDAMTKIGQNAFYKCTAMTSINMPTSLTAIGEKAFAQDTKLACEIILPVSMTNIASRAFFNCQAVTAFHIEATTPPTIPNDAFERTTAPIHVPCGYGHIYGKHTQWGMLNLEMCELLQDNVYYYPIDGHTARAVTYHSNPTDTIVIPSAVVIDGMPRTVTEVADFAFTDCKDIPAIIFNEGLEYIGERAFVRCYGLQGTIVLPATLETIGERAFSYCDNVEKYLILAMTPPALGDGAFTCANHDALFYVSCEVMDDYKVAARWSSLKSRLRDACLNIYHYNTPLGTNGVYTTEDTLVASIYYRRQFTPYRWETLYLPFEVDRVTVLEEGVEYDLTAWDIVDGGHYFLAKPDGMLNKEILFGFTDELASHTPYIIQFSDAYYTDKLITFYGKESWNKLSTSFEVLSSSAWMQIAGNTTLQDQLLEKPVYMLRSGLDFILQKTTTTLHPFECYVMPYTAQSGAPARMNVRFREDVPTAVESVKGNESHLTYSVDGYTLTVYPQGQAFSIYSLNGALIYSCEAGKEAVDCELNSGCYLLHAGTEAHKIML